MIIYLIIVLFSCKKDDIITQYKTHNKPSGYENNFIKTQTKKNSNKIISDKKYIKVHSKIKKVIKKKQKDNNISDGKLNRLLNPTKNINRTLRKKNSKLINEKNSIKHSDVIKNKRSFSSLSKDKKVNTKEYKNFNNIKKKTIYQETNKSNKQKLENNKVEQQNKKNHKQIKVNELLIESDNDFLKKLKTSFLKLAAETTQVSKSKTKKIKKQKKNKIKKIYLIGAQSLDKILIVKNKLIKLSISNFKNCIANDSSYKFLLIMAAIIEVDLLQRVCLKIIQSCAISMQDAEIFLNAESKSSKILDELRINLKINTIRYRKRFIRVSSMNIIKEIYERSNEIRSSFDFEGSIESNLTPLVYSLEFFYRWSLQSDYVQVWQKEDIKNYYLKAFNLLKNYVLNQTTALAHKMLKDQRSIDEIYLKTGLSIKKLNEIEHDRFKKAQESLNMDKSNVDYISKETGYSVDELLKEKNSQPNF